MNDTVQHTHGRLAALNPFDLEVNVAAQRAGAETYPAGLCGKSVTEFGCVDWYQYPGPSDAIGKAH